MPHSTEEIYRNRAGMSEKMLYLPAGRQGGNLSLSPGSMNPLNNRRDASIMEEETFAKPSFQIVRLAGKCPAAPVFQARARGTISNDHSSPGSAVLWTGSFIRFSEIFLPDHRIFPALQ